MSTKTEKIGILGGTFNPIHNGHLMLASDACKTFCLDKVVLVPTGHTWYKKFSGEEMSRHRCRMVELAIGDDPRFCVSFDEIRRETVSYTYQTLERLEQEYAGAQLYFILGGDCLDDFSTWRYPERICAAAVILVAARGDVNGKKMDSEIKAMEKKYHGDFRRLDTPLVDISSSKIREYVKEGRNIRDMVPAAVADYISQYGLYREDE